MDFEAHFEEFLYLAGLGHDKALISWGGFYFRRGDSPYGEWRIVDDEELAAVAPTPRSEAIGASSEPFGHAGVEIERDGRVVARAETDECNHVWVTGLEPDTEYRYVVSGAAGKLRTEIPSHFEEAGTRSWAAAGHFLLAHADERRLTVQPSPVSATTDRSSRSPSPIQRAVPATR